MYVQSNTILLVDVFQNFGNMCLEKYEYLILQSFDPELAWQAALKKTEVKLDPLTDINVLLMVEKGIKGGFWYSFYRYAKGNYKYMKYYDRNKESSYLQQWDVNYLYGWAMLQKLWLNNFEWIKDTPHFDKDLIKNYNEVSDEGYT